MSTIVPNAAQYWGLFPSTSALPNVSGSSTSSPNVRIGDLAYVAELGAYVCTNPTDGSAAWASFSSSGGPGIAETLTGPYTCTTGVGVVPALYGSLVFVAPREGSITSLSGYLSEAATDDDITAEVLIEGSQSGLTNTFTSGGNVFDYSTATAGTIPINAGEVVIVATVGGAALSNTPLFGATVGFTSV